MEERSSPLSCPEPSSSCPSSSEKGVRGAWGRSSADRVDVNAAAAVVVVVMRLANELAGSAAGVDVVSMLIADPAEVDPTRTAAGGRTGAPESPERHAEVEIGPAGGPEEDAEVAIDPTAPSAEEPARIGLDGPADESSRGVEVEMNAEFGMPPTEAAVVERDSPADDAEVEMDAGMTPTGAADVAGKNEDPPRGTESPEGRTERTIMGILEKKRNKKKTNSK